MLQKKHLRQKFLNPNIQMCKFSLKVSKQKSVQNFFAKIVQSGCFCYMAS